MTISVPNEDFVAWLRIEPRCRQDNLTTGIQARTADPLWLLARQWQTGEFQGEDAGSPIKVEMRYSIQPLNRVKLDDRAKEPLPSGMPLETMVEQELGDVDFRERVRIGQEFERRLRTQWKSSGMPGDVNTLILNMRAQEQIGFPIPPEPAGHDLDLRTQRFIRFMRGRVVDGLAVLNDGLSQIVGTPEVCALIHTVGMEVRDWYASVCRRPAAEQPPAWQPEKLDYRFEVSSDPSIEIDFTKPGHGGVIISGREITDTLFDGLISRPNMPSQQVLVGVKGTRITLPKSACAVRVTYGRLDKSKDSLQALDKKGANLDVCVTLEEALGEPWALQVAGQTSATREIAMASYLVVGKDLSSIDISGHIAVGSIHVDYGEGTRLVAPDYRNGTVDWYSFNAASKIAEGPWIPPEDPKLCPQVSTPTRIELTGASPRWWAFEDGYTDFGAMEVGKTDLSKLLLMEFVLINGDDWFSVPLQVPMGCLVKIDELKVWNVFGDITSVEPARRVYPDTADWTGQQDADYRPAEVLSNRARFDLFTLAGPTPQDPGLDARAEPPAADGIMPAARVYAQQVWPGVTLPRRLASQLAPRAKSATTTTSVRSVEQTEQTLGAPRPILLIPPVAGFRLESPPMDEVHFLRDEGANMVWGVEHIVQNQLGRPISGFDAQQEQYERWRELLSSLLLRLNRLLEYGEPSDDDRLVLESAVGELENRIIDCNPYARPTPSQNSIPKYRLATTVPENWIPFIPVRRKSVMKITVPLASQPIKPPPEDSGPTVVQIDKPLESIPAEYAGISIIPDSGPVENLGKPSDIAENFAAHQMTPIEQMSTASDSIAENLAVSSGQVSGMPASAMANQAATMRRSATSSASFKSSETQQTHLPHPEIQFQRAKMLRNWEHSRMENLRTIALRQFFDLYQMMENNPLIGVSEVSTYLQELPTTESHPFATDEEDVAAQSRLLKLDEDALLFINEETIPRAGLRVQLTRQRVRWVDGSTHVWLGRKVLTGRGEGSSGLRFDYLKTDSSKS